MLIQVAVNETLLDDSIRLADRAKQAGVDVILEKWDDMFHVWQSVVGLGVPESRNAIEEITKFFQKHTGG